MQIQEYRRRSAAEVARDRAGDWLDQSAMAHAIMDFCEWLERKFSRTMVWKPIKWTTFVLIIPLLTVVFVCHFLQCVWERRRAKLPRHDLKPRK